MRVCSSLQFIQIDRVCLLLAASGCSWRRLLYLVLISLAHELLLCWFLRSEWQGIVVVLVRSKDIWICFVLPLCFGEVYNILAFNLSLTLHARCLLAHLLLGMAVALLLHMQLVVVVNNAKRLALVILKISLSVAHHVHHRLHAVDVILRMILPRVGPLELRHRAGTIFLALLCNELAPVCYRLFVVFYYRTFPLPRYLPINAQRAPCSPLAWDDIRRVLCAVLHEKVEFVKAIAVLSVALFPIGSVDQIFRKQLCIFLLFPWRDLGFWRGLKTTVAFMVKFSIQRVSVLSIESLGWQSSRAILSHRPWMVFLFAFLFVKLQFVPAQILTLILKEKVWRRCLFDSSVSAIVIVIRVLFPALNVFMVTILCLLAHVLF